MDQDQSNNAPNENASGAEEARIAMVLARLDSLRRSLDDDRRRLRRRRDLANSDRLATNRAPEEVIDLTSPERNSASVAGNDDGPPPPERSCPDQKQEPYKCPVCLEFVRMREPVATKCGHVFCKECLISAIWCFPKCPLCNERLSILDFHRIYL